MQLQLIFSNILATDAFLQLDNDKLLSYAYGLMQTTNGREYSNRGGWQSEFVEDKPELAELVGCINDRLDAIKYNFGFKDNYQLKVESMWININPPYSYNSNHLHPNSYLSGVYYVKVPKDSGNLVLRHPTHLHAFATDKDAIDSYNEFNSSKWYINSQENNLVIFPSWIEHEVTQNLSNEDRISIAFNSSFYNED